MSHHHIIGSGIILAIIIAVLHSPALQADIANLVKSAVVSIEKSLPGVVGNTTNSTVNGTVNGSKLIIGTGTSKI